MRPHRSDSLRHGAKSVALLATLLLVTACSGGGGSPGGSGGGGPPGGGAKRAAGPRLVSVVSPRPAPRDRTLQLNGAIEAMQNVQVAARVEGAVTRVLVDLGDRVHAGQPLARISPTDYRARLAQTSADTEQAASDRARQQQLAGGEYSTPQAVEQAGTRLRVAQAQRALAARQLADTTVRAPFSGAIAQRYVSEGAYARIGTALFDLVSVDDLRLALEVPALYASAVHEGDLARITVQGSSTPVAQAPIVRVSPAISPQTRTFRVEARVAEGDHGLRPGMFVVGTLRVGRAEDAVRVPRGAVVNVLGHDRVMLVVSGRVTPREVEMIAEDGPDAIVRGISLTDDVVARGAGTLAPGMQVRTEPFEPARADDSRGSGAGNPG